MTPKTLLASEYGEMKKLLRQIPSLILALLILSVVSMNLLANKELLKTDWIALDCGFALSWIPFLIMDCICKVLGGKAAFRVSLLAIIINLATFLIFRLISLTPGMWGEYYATGSLQVNSALNATIGGSTWIVLGSAAAMAVSSAANSITNVLMGTIARGNGYGSFAARSFTSTAIAQFIDNLTFASIVSIPLFGWSWRQTLICSLTCAAFELIMEIAFSGFGYRLAKNWQEV